MAIKLTNNRTSSQLYTVIRYGLPENVSIFTAEILAMRTYGT